MVERSLSLLCLESWRQFWVPWGLLSGRWRLPVLEDAGRCSVLRTNQPAVGQQSTLTPPWTVAPFPWGTLFSAGDLWNLTPTPYTTHVFILQLHVSFC